MRRMILGFALLIAGTLVLSPVVRAQDAPATPTQQVAKAPASENPEYRKSIEGRAAKIVAKLALTDEEKSKRVQEVVMKHYFNLSDWQEKFGEELKGLKKANTDEAKARIAEIETERQKYHDECVKGLETDLTPEQVAAVKDGMTYNVLHVTYDAYMGFVPDMSDELKKMIMDNLTEAREKAMDGTSSKEKHAIFGKYKGRINNELSKAGIDMKKAEKEFFAKQKSEKAAQEAAGQPEKKAEEATPEAAGQPAPTAVEGAK